MRCIAATLTVLVLLAADADADAELSATDVEAQQRAEAEAAHEARAQQALTDSLTDGLAMLKHGSAGAREQAAAGIASLAIETTISQPYHPVTFRNACVRAGVVHELVKLLGDSAESSTPEAKFHALRALEAIATDDPSTELDNGHALATCEAGAVPPLVVQLQSTDVQLQFAAAGCAAVLAENPQCQTLLMQHGVIKPLLALATYGSNAAKLKAIAALDVLALNNPAAHQAIAAAGGLKMLQGVQKFGGAALREVTNELLQGVAAPDSLTLAVDTAGHAKQAHKARLKHSKLWQSASSVQRAQAPQQHAPDE